MQLNNGGYGTWPGRTLRPGDRLPRRLRRGYDRSEARARAELWRNRSLIYVHTLEGVEDAEIIESRRRSLTTSFAWRICMGGA
jgi:hypothetical protein